MSLLVTTSAASQGGTNWLIIPLCCFCELNCEGVGQQAPRRLGDDVHQVPHPRCGQADPQRALRVARDLDGDRKEHRHPQCYRQGCGRGDLRGALSALPFFLFFATRLFFLSAPLFERVGFATYL